MVGRLPGRGGPFTAASSYRAADGAADRSSVRPPVSPSVGPSVWRSISRSITRTYHSRASQVRSHKAHGTVTVTACRLLFLFVGRPEIVVADTTEDREDRDTRLPCVDDTATGRSCAA